MKNLESIAEYSKSFTNQELHEKLLKYCLHGMSKSALDRYTSIYKHWDMELLGYKCNMNDIQASILLPQLERVDVVHPLKEQICKKYELAFLNFNGVDYPKKLNNSVHARHIFTIWVSSSQRDNILTKLQESGIGVAVNFRSIHLLSYYKNTFGYKSGDY